jgi:hypothetical protein
MGRDRGVAQLDVGGKSEDDRFGHGSLQQDQRAIKRGSAKQSVNARAGLHAGVAETLYKAKTLKISARP